MAEIPGAVSGLIKPPENPNFELKKPELENGKQVYQSFGETLKGFVEDVNNLQEQSGKTVERFLTGEIENVHDVMIAVEKAGVSFEMMMEIRNKMIEAYHELMRMQV